MAETPKTINEKELEILSFWDKNKTFEKSLKQTEGKEEFVFYDGPPFATGLPHYGHLLASMEKDVIPRFWTMKGKHVRRVWGWDCHGLPIENIAEKELKINSKDEIEKMGVDKFNAFCRSKVLSYADDWEKVIRRIGRWVDMKNCYKTMDNSYIESVWWIFKQMWDKGLIYEGEKILMYCPRCSTPLAKSEIAMGDSYQTRKDETITIKFKLKDEDVYALAWTTTPWTLPSNLALTVNPHLTYAYVKDKKDDTTYLLAKELISKFYKSQEDYEITKEILGEKLKGIKYEPLFPYFEHLKNSFRIVLGDFVTAEDGTGIVHTAPAFGEEDYYVCKANGIDFVSPVDERGRFTKEVTDYAGQYIFDTNTPIIIELKKQGKIIKIEKKEHEYPFCYRCDTPLFYKAMPALFVNITKIKDNLIKSNKTVNWHPEFLKEGRVNHTFETAPDWNISRNRFWAASIPVWKSKSGKIKVIGSIEELKKYATNLPKNKMDLHKDFVDKIKIEVDEEEMTRIPDVFDCWFESGSMPYAQLHYPFENKDLFEKMYPADFVAEGLDQTRGWFYTLAVISNALFERAPFKNVLVNGLVLAEDGKKMSKKLSNYPDPMTVIEKYGVDTLRFYLLGSIVMNADNFNFSEKGLEEIYKKVLMLLYNVDNFYALYPNIKENSKPNSNNILDKWILSRLNNLNKKIDEYYLNYNPIKVCSETKVFVEDLSTWYIRRNRDRFNDGDKDAKTTLKEVLSTFSKIIAPLMPFVAEMIYRNLGNKDSVHLQNWPEYDEKLINVKLETEMKQVKEIISIALRERDVKKLPLKQPLNKIIISIKEKESLEKYKEIFLEELNIKSLEFKLPVTKETEFAIELDTVITPELEAEGMAREIVRNIQAARKKANLIKEDLIELEIIFEKDLTDNVKKFIVDETKRIGAKKISFAKTNQKFDYSQEGKIKDSNYKVSFSKL